MVDLSSLLNTCRFSAIYLEMCQGSNSLHGGLSPTSDFRHGLCIVCLGRPWHKQFATRAETNGQALSLKGECNRPGTPLSLEDARRLVKGHVEHYNSVRLNRAIGYITPKNMLAGHQQEIQADRDRKLEAAREQRKNRRHWAA